MAGNINWTINVQKKKGSLETTKGKIPKLQTKLILRSLEPKSLNIYIFKRKIIK